MIDWRTHLASLLLPLAVGAALSLTALPAAAQPSAPEPGAEMEAQPALEAQPEAQSDFGPQSPEEEAALRQATLDALFERLAQRDDPNWANVENEIWLAWSKSGSPSMDLLLLRAGRAMDSGDSELALRHLDDLVRLAPDFAEGWNKRATVYFLLNEFGRSVADIERTLALEPRHFGAMLGLGTILERVGDKKGAMRAYRRGLQVHPNLQGAAAAVERLSSEVDGREL
jgi:tetratricopeptide (TPR) repeat protein